MKSETLDLLIDSEMRVTPPKVWQSRALGLTNLGLMVVGWYWYGWWCTVLMIASSMTASFMCIMDGRIFLQRLKERYTAGNASGKSS